MAARGWTAATSGRATGGRRPAGPAARQVQRGDVRDLGVQSQSEPDPLDLTIGGCADGRKRGPGSLRQWWWSRPSQDSVSTTPPRSSRRVALSERLSHTWPRRFWCRAVPESSAPVTDVLHVPWHTRTLTRTTRRPDPSCVSGWFTHTSGAPARHGGRVARTRRSPRPHPTRARRRPHPSAPAGSWGRAAPPDSPREAAGARLANHCQCARTAASYQRSLSKLAVTHRAAPRRDRPAAAYDRRRHVPRLHRRRPGGAGRSDQHRRPLRAPHQGHQRGTATTSLRHPGQRSLVVQRPRTPVSGSPESETRVRIPAALRPRTSHEGVRSRRGSTDPRDRIPRRPRPARPPGGRRPRPLPEVMRHRQRGPHRGRPRRLPHRPPRQGPRRSDQQLVGVPADDGPVGVLVDVRPLSGPYSLVDEVLDAVEEFAGHGSLPTGW